MALSRRRFLSGLCVGGASIATALVVKPSVGLANNSESKQEEGVLGKDNYCPTAYHLDYKLIPKVRYLEYPTACSS